MGGEASPDESVGHEPGENISEQGDPGGGGQKPMWQGPVIKGSSLHPMQGTRGKSVEDVGQRGGIIMIFKDYT